MDYPTIELKWEEILSSAITGLLRQTESMRQQINWGHGANFDIYKQWGMTVSGSICEQALAKKWTATFHTQLIILKVLIYILTERAYKSDRNL